MNVCCELAGLVWSLGHGLPHADSKGAWLVCCTCTCTVNTLMVFMSKDYHSSFKCLITSEVTNVHVLLGPPKSRTRATRTIFLASSIYSHAHKGSFEKGKFPNREYIQYIDMQLGVQEGDLH